MTDTQDMTPEDRDEQRRQEREDELAKARDEAQQGTRDYLGRKVGGFDELHKSDEGEKSQR